MGSESKKQGISERNVKNIDKTCKLLNIKEKEDTKVGRKKGYERIEVLERAMDLFWKKGYEGAHLQELVDVTGLNRFSLYKEFGGKEGLFDEALAMYIDRVRGALEPLRQEPLSVQNVLQFFEEMNMSFFKYGCFLVNTLPEKHLIDRATYQRTLEFTKEFGELVKKNLQASKARGEFQTDVNVQALTDVISAIDFGMVMMSINADKSTSSSIARGVRQLITAQLR